MANVNINFSVSEEEARKFMEVLGIIHQNTTNANIKKVLGQLHYNIKIDYWISTQAELMVLKMLRELTGKHGIKTTTSLKHGLQLTNFAIAHKLPPKCNGILVRISNLAKIPRPEKGIKSQDTLKAKKVSDLIKLIENAFI